MVLTNSDFLLAVIAILFPPVAVWAKSGLCSADLLINIALCVLGYLPGLLHAWYLIIRAAEAREGYEDLENAIHERRGEYEPILQFDHTSEQNQQQTGVVDGPSYAEVTAGGSSSQPKNKSGPSDQPPSYSAIVKGDHKVQT